MFVSGDDIKKLRIGLASPDEMRRWSKGEVTESETINYRTHRPERGGLFAEEIFGPENDFECGCGKYRGRKYEGIKCEKCGVLVTDKSVRRVNMGHIDLASPVVHFWYLKGVSSPLSTLLGLKRVTLKRIAYYETESRQEELSVVTESPDDDTMLGEILSKTQQSILQLKKKFKAEPAFLIESSAAVVAEVAGKVEVVPMKLENGEEITMVRVGEREYPLSTQAEVLVRSGETVKAGAALAESPLGRSEQLISEWKFNALRQFHPQIKGAKAVDTVDNLLYLVTEVKGADFPKQVGDLLLEDEKYAYERIYRGQFEAHTGALGIQGVLANLDLNRLSRQLKAEVNAEPSEGKRKRLLKRLEIVEHLRGSGNRSQDMVMEVIPVMPPNLRPIVQLEGGKFATTDLNDLYRRIINRNNRLKKLKEMGAPEVILRNERRMLQEAVDALIYNEKKENPILGRDNRPLKSLSERISGKQGRLRRNLLGKRVDYSGRAVIVVNPKLKLHQCGLPKKMALELFRPFIHQQLQLLEKQVPITNYDELKNKALSGEMPEVWDVLDRVIKDHPVLLNRAPTLHRLGIQAFEPVLVDGEAIQIHPFVCAPYNADFDGDTMSVHVPLYPAAVREARELMLSSRNILSPASGEPLSMPTQDFIFVVYYLTAPPHEGKGSKRQLAFSDEVDALRAYEDGHITLQSLIDIRVDGKLMKTTLGRVLFNRILPQDLRDFERVFDSGAVRNVIMTCYHAYGNDRVVQLLEDLKQLGLEYGARSGLTISVRDCLIPEQKPGILTAARSRVFDINEKFEEGLSTDTERKEAVIKVWRETVDQMEDVTMENFATRRYNPIYAIVESGARGSSNQVKQLAGMRGPMTDPSGETLEMPVISNFREGLTTMEFFISTHGGRKGTADTALKTADSGYLTRRLVDACEELVVTQEDCQTTNGIELDPLYFAKGQVMEGLETRLYGRCLAADVRFDGQVVGQRNGLIDEAAAKELGELQLELKVKDSKFSQHALGTKCVDDVRVRVGKGKGDKVIVARDEAVTQHLIEQLKKYKVDSIRVRPVLMVRSALTCEAERGICQRCYGLDLSCHRPVALGTAVGVIAAESIGEPGTQLTMRTFHTGGVAGEDITQGLPRAEELFEARKALRSAQGDIAPISGHVVSVETLPDGREQVQLEGETQTIVLPRALCQVQPGDQAPLAQFIAAKSALNGRLDTIEVEGVRHALVLEEDDAVVLLPPGATATVKNGQVIKANARLSSAYHLPPVKARQAGKVKEVSQDKKTGTYVVVLVDDAEQAQRYTLPVGAEPEVSAKETVEAGTLLSSEVKCEPLVAPRGGKVFVDDRRLLILDSKVEGKLLPLTDGVVIAKQAGSRVSVGEPLLSVASAEGGAQATVDKVEALDEHTVAVSYRFETALNLINTPLVREGDKVRQGDLISKGVISPHVLLKEAGVRATREYLLAEIHKVYKSQGVDINDKHIELVIRQMLNNISIEDGGDSPFTPNQIVPLGEFRRATQQMVEENQQIRLQKTTVLGAALAEDVVDLKGSVIGKKGQTIEQEALEQWMEQGVDEVTVQRVEGPAVVRVVEKKLPSGERILLRISKAALESKSWLSAASFQRTTMVLDQAALKGAHDELESLKANVIISSLIPAGTGFGEPSETVEEADGAQPPEVLETVV